MDLPSCPSCGQSVLDDDAEECPFCGASMSGAPVKQKPAGPAASQGPPAAKKSASSRQTKKENESANAARTAKTGSAEKQAADAANDDPFAVDTSAAQKAIPLRPKPVKGRTHKVVCPMCETTGYTSPKAGGQEVRCCNPECLVPLFTAPKVDKPKPIEEPVKQGSSKLLFAAAAAVSVAAVAGGIYYFVFSSDGLPDDQGAGINGGINHNPTDDTDQQPDKVEPGNQPPNGDANQDKSATLATIRRTALETMVESSLQRDNNRSKSFCRRLTAEAFAVDGDVDGARQQLELMNRQRTAVAYYRILPLVEIAWQELKAGDSAAAGKTLDTALTFVEGLPNRGRSRLDFAIELAIALAAVGRSAEAQALIGQHQDATATGQLSAEIFAVRSFRTYDLAASADDEPILPWVSPQTIAVTLGLAAHGYWDAAQKWAESQTELDVRTEALIAWAAAFASRKPTDGQPVDTAAVEQAAKQLTVEGQARLYARVAGRLFAAGRKAESSQFLAKAGDALATLSPSAEFVLPDMKGLIELKLPDPAAFRMRALAAAEVAQTQFQAGESSKAWAACELAMKFLRGSAPSPSAILRRINEIDDLGSREIRDQLKRLLDLDNDDQARQAFSDYRKNCNRISVAAGNRFSVQTAILAAAARWGLLDSVWKEIDARAQQSNLNDREPWMLSRVPWMLTNSYEAAGNANAAKPIHAALRAAGGRRPTIDRITRTASTLLDEDRAKQAAREFEKRYATEVPQAERDRRRLQIVCRLVADDKLDKAFEFIRTISDKDTVLREDALRLVAAQATRAGHANKIWAIGQKTTWSATEVVSIYRGLIEALDIEKPRGTANARNGDHGKSAVR